MGYTISYTVFQIHFPHTNTNPRRGRGAHHGPALEGARPAEARALAGGGALFECHGGGKQWMSASNDSCGRRLSSREMTIAWHWRGRGWQSRRRSRRAASAAGGRASAVGGGMRAVVYERAGAVRARGNWCVAECGRACTWIIFT
jgi:hypothetical protein